jgi:hypothetical protein
MRGHDDGLTRAANDAIAAVALPTVAQEVDVGMLGDNDALASAAGGLIAAVALPGVTKKVQMGVVGNNHAFAPAAADGSKAAVTLPSVAEKIEVRVFGNLHWLTAGSSWTESSVALPPSEHGGVCVLWNGLLRAAWLRLEDQARKSCHQDHRSSHP